MSRILSTMAAASIILAVTLAARPALADLGLTAVARPNPAALTNAGPGPTSPLDEHTLNLKLMSNQPPSRPDVQSDIAFTGNLAIAGTFDGFRIVDISSPAKPQMIVDFPCNGGQGDVSVFGNLLFQSVDTPQSSPFCDSTDSDASTPGSWEGVRAFDISDPTNPVHIDSYRTDCGSHTHTVVPRPDMGRVFIYVASYPLTPVNIGLVSECIDLQTDPVGGGHRKISIIEVPLGDPTNETVIEHPLDAGTEVATFDLDTPLGLPPGTLGTHSFVACHDISVFTELNLAAGACMSEAQLWDISDPRNPVFVWRFDDPALDHEFDISLWHSAAFSWDGEVVAFGDENGGGALPRCVDPSNDKGRVWFVDTATGGFLANWKVPRSVPGICTAHNFNFIPQKRGRKNLVIANYTAGVSVVDVNALTAGLSEADAEVGFFNPNSTDPQTGALTSNQWSAYWYNGFIYVNDEVRGLDVMLLSDRARAGQQKLDIMNAQSQIDVIK